TIAVAVLITLRVKKEIKPVEAITWSWKKMYQRVKQSIFTKIILGIGLLYGIFMGLFTGMMVDVISTIKGTNTSGFSPVAQGTFSGLITFLSLAAPYLLLLGNLVGWSGEVLSKPHFARPNQGIHHSARHALLLGFLNGPLLGLIGGGLGSFSMSWFFLSFLKQV